jgi:ribosomal-protein-serine acetyltransferase
LFSKRIADDIELRIMEERHAAESYALIDRNREPLREYLSWIDDTRSVEDRKGSIRRSRAYLANNDGFTAGIWYRGEHAGTIGVNGIDWQFRKADIGYWLGQEFWSKGIMTRACRAVVAHLFDDFGLNKVEIRVAVTNARSLAIPARLGFVEEGVLRDSAVHYDYFEDLRVFGILASEWHALNAAGK